MKYKKEGIKAMFDFVRVAGVHHEITVGNVVANANKIIEMAELAAKEKADIVVFPELCVTGYTCGDLFFQKTLQKGAVEALEKIAKENKKHKNTIIVGAPLVIKGQLYNCAVIMCFGKICGIVPKTFIPISNGFSEKRWFSSSKSLKTDKIKADCIGFSGDYEIPVGKNLVFEMGGMFFATEICEDSFSPVSPTDFLALNGAELIINISASNEMVGKREYRKELVKSKSARLMSGVVFVSSGAEESTTDMVFSGHTIIAENGSIIAENDQEPSFEGVLVKDIDIGKIKKDRMGNKTFIDSASLYGDFEPCAWVGLPQKELNGDGSISDIRKNPFVLSDPKQMKNRCIGIFKTQMAGLKKRMKITQGKVIVGVSGGLDSTLALLVAAKTAMELKRPATDVVGITMPCFGTTDRTYNNALKLMKTLGIKTEEINIEKACLQHFSDIGQDKNCHDVTYENSQARERTQVLMDYAGKVGGFVVGTGDLSELALGWCTFNGDHMSMYGVNAGVPKTLLRYVIESIIEEGYFPKSKEVLEDILATPISPELLPPDKKGEILQKTEDIIGPYALHDFFLFYVIRYGFEPAKIYHLAKLAFSNEFDDETILKWIESFYKRFFAQQFKRNCMPDGVKVGSVGLSPRGDWQMPSDASVAIWTEEIENLK